MRAKTFSINDIPINASALSRELEGQGVGAIVTFEGRVRDHNDGRVVEGLTYQAYIELAEAEGMRIIEEARAKFPIMQASCAHRIGDLALGELAVWAGVSAGHRVAAFDACRYIIDEVKTRVPIWKREHYVEGTSDWLHPKAE